MPFHLKFFFILLPHLVFSQNRCDCELLNNESNDLIDFTDSTKVYKHIEKLKTGHPGLCSFQALALELKYHFEKRNAEEIKTCLSQQEQILKELECDELVFDFYYNKALYYRLINDFERLSTFAFKALKLAEKQKDKKKQIQIIKQIVYLFTRIREKEKRWNYVKQGETLILKLKDSTNYVSNYRWLAYEYESKYTETNRKALIAKGLQYANKVKGIAIKKKLNDEVAMLYRALEAFSYHKGELRNAITYIDSAIYFGKKIKGTKNLSGLYLSKAWDHLDLREFDEANKWMDTAIFYDNDKTDIAGYMMLQFEASEIYGKIGETDKAYSSFKAYSKIKDSILNTKRIEAINELETKYKTELKDAQIKKLIVLLVIASLVIVCIVLIASMIQLKRTKQKNHELKLAFEKQIKLEKELSDVRDEIAQDFHDDLGNKLARISLLSNLISGEVSIKNPKVKSKIQQISEDANGLYKGTRDFIFSLKSNSNYLEEVTTYLSDFGGDIFDKTKIKFIVNKNISKNIKLPYHWNKQLIFIFKEALTNALKHSKSHVVKLSFNYHNEELVVICEDDGIGVLESDLESLNGLSHMKARANKIDCKLSINSSIGKGTTIVFKGKLK